jgi:transcriptional regulator with XRE-family HTH domain
MVRKKHRNKGLPLKIALLEHGLTQKEAGEHLGMGLSTFNMKLIGNRHFTASEREKLAKLLDKPEGKLFPTKLDNGSEENTQEIMGG